MSGTTEAFARVRIDDLLKDAGWNLTDGVSVLFEHALPDGTQADYVLCDRWGRPMAALEAKRVSTDPIRAQDQGRHYAERLGVPFVFLSNGEEVRFLDRETDAHARKIAGFWSQDDLERRIAARRNQRALSKVAIERKIVDRDYQIECIEALSAEVSRGRRKLLVEMATGTGKTRTAAAFVKRLFEAGIVTRVLFLVDRIALAGQAEDAFTDHLRDYPCHVLRPGRGFDRAKRITIATLQTMIADYRMLSPGYFDLVITDECHRSIYGKYGGVLRHFDGIQLGLTATPCTADADTLPDPEDGLFVRDTLRFFGLERPTFRYTLRRAIEEGHLVPYRIYKAMTVKTAAGDGFSVRRDELDWSTMDKSTQAEFEELFSESDTITVDPRALERKFTVPERNRAMVREFRDAHENQGCVTIREREPAKLRHAQPAVRIVADDAVDHSHHAEPLDRAAQLIHGILPTAHSRRPTLVQAEGTPHLATYRNGIVGKASACREDQWLRFVLYEMLAQPRLPPLHGVESVDQIRARSGCCRVRNGAEIGNREAFVGRLAQKQVAEWYMDGAGECLQLFQGGLSVATLPFGKLFELRR